MIFLRLFLMNYEKLRLRELAENARLVRSSLRQLHLQKDINKQKTVNDQKNTIKLL